jgi:hypothetical protein
VRQHEIRTEEIMKRLSIFLSAILMSGCALWPSQFDAQEQNAIVDLVVMSRFELCRTPEIATHAHAINLRAEWLQVYSSSLPNNEKIQAMNTNMVEMTQDLAKRYQGDAAASRFFCESRMKNINKAARTMLDVSGRRPRS